MLSSPSLMGCLRSHRDLFLTYLIPASLGLWLGAPLVFYASEKNPILSHIARKCLGDCSCGIPQLKTDLFKSSGVPCLVRDICETGLQLSPCLCPGFLALSSFPPLQIPFSPSSVSVYASRELEIVTSRGLIILTDISGVLARC